MFYNDLFTVDGLSNNSGTIEATIIIDEQHKIFEGHFPGQPVLPGVCMMQIIKELTEDAIGKKLFLGKADQCKFLSMVDPLKNNKLLAIIKYAELEKEVNIDVILKTEAAIFLKMKASLQIV